MAAAEKSLTKIVVMVLIGIALLGWGFLAGSYSGAHDRDLSEVTAAEIKVVA